MPRITSGKRYAQAAFELAQERKDPDSWKEALVKIAAVTEDEKLMPHLENPRLPIDVKKRLLEMKLGEINPLAFNLALLLVSKGALRLSRDILKQYQYLLDLHRGIKRAEVTVASPLEDGEREAISRRLGEIIGYKITIDAHVDPGIIGGFIARIDDMLIDASIRQRLEDLRKSLVEARR